MRPKPRSKTISIRFDKKSLSRIRRAAIRTGTPASAVVRLSVLLQLSQIEAASTQLVREAAEAVR